MLIILPGHLQVSGVTTWAMRAVAGLRARSIESGLIVHCDKNHSPPDFLLPYVVGVVEDAPPMDDLHGCLNQLTPVYLDAIRRIHAITKKPVIVSPNLHGDCFGAIAAIAREHPELIRVTGWIHADNDYDLTVCNHYQSILHAIVPVSNELANLACQRMPDRHRDIIHVPHGIDVPDQCPQRTPITDRPLRLLYTGRIEEYQKRVSVLPELSARLSNQGIKHQLRIIGNGPEMPALREQSDPIQTIELLGAIPPEQIDEHLRWADAWVLPSRFEGQSIAMLEAMAMGCVPLLTRVRSGSHDAVVHGVSGLSVEAQWDTPIKQIARELSDAIAELDEQTRINLSTGAHRVAYEHHRTDIHIDALESLIQHVQAMAPRPWPSDQRPSYTAPPGQRSGSTPHDAADRMEHCLRTLEGKSVLIFGSGQHTKDIAGVFENTRTHIAGFIDDNPSKAGTSLLNSRIYEPKDIPSLGASDLIISSAIHQDSIWRNRASLESMGVTVHRLYTDDGSVDPKA